MENPKSSKNWVQIPKHCRWGFETPRPELLKVSIDFRRKFHDQTHKALHDQTHKAPSQHSSNLDLTSYLAEHKNWQASSSRAGSSQQGVKASSIFSKENRLPKSATDPKQIHPFGGFEDKGGYFGGPILNKCELRWRPTFLTRACGDVVGPGNLYIPLPSNSNEIVKAVAAMSGRSMMQSGIWVGPRLLIATLHIHDWIHRYPSNEECQMLCHSDQTFRVESEISSQILSEFSPELKLIHFSAQNDIGIFKLLDHYPPRSDWVRPEFLMEREEVYQHNLLAGRKLACLGFSGGVSELDERMIKEEAAVQLRKQLYQLAFSVETLNIDNAIKPQMRVFAPGTLDKASGSAEQVIFGVSCSLWKGSSGGPCILLDGPEAGAIIGLVRGYDSISDPFNLVNGFPDGLKNLIKEL